MTINLDKVIWEGWRVQDFINDLEPMFRMIQEGRSWQQPLTSEQELKKWLMSEQPYYKKHIPEVFEYFKEKL